MSNNENTKHTPGPWRTYSGGTKGPGPWSVETLSCRVADIHESYTDEGAANARLIAAAPELFAACRAATDIIQRTLDYGQIDTDSRADLAATMDRLESVIAKAKGK